MFPGIPDTACRYKTIFERGILMAANSFCNSCGAPLTEGSLFCPNCGAGVNAGAPAPVYTAPSAAVSAPPVKKKKKGLRALIITLIVLLILGAGGFAAYQFLLGKTDLGVAYTDADTKSVMGKIGLTIDSSKVPKGGSTKIGDYNWTFSNYQRKTFNVTPAEAMAFFNTIAPGFWWFDNTQIKIGTDGSIITSSTLNIGKMKNELFPDVAKYIPIPLPDSAGLYTKGQFSIVNNKISMNPETIKVGAVEVPKDYLTGSNLTTFSGYLERIYKVIPGLEIYSAKQQGTGFVFDGKIPTKVTVTPK